MLGLLLLELVAPTGEVTDGRSGRKGHGHMLMVVIHALRKVMCVRRSLALAYPRSSLTLSQQTFSCSQ